MKSLGLIITVVILVILAATWSGPVRAIENEIILSENYLTEPQKEQVKKQFFLDTVVGFASTSQQLGYGPTAEYYKRLKLEESKTWLGVTLHPTYIVSPRIALRGSLPVAMVERKREKLFDESELGFGVGDIGVDAIYMFMAETDKSPEVTFLFSVNANNSEYSSLGDGFWDFVPAVSVKKYLSPSFYQTWLLQYIVRQSSDVQEYNTLGLRAGLGWARGASIDEVQLELLNHGSDAPSEKQDVGLRWTTKNVFGSYKGLKGGDISFFYYGLNHSLTLDANYWGVEYSFIF